LPLDYDGPADHDLPDRIDSRDFIDFLFRRVSGPGMDLLSLIHGIDPRGPMLLKEAAAIVGMKRTTASYHIDQSIAEIRSILSEVP
jgi:hypothetical protein